MVAIVGDRRHQLKLRNSLLCLLPSHPSWLLEYVSPLYHCGSYLLCALCAACAHMLSFLQTRRANRGGYAEHDDFEGLSQFWTQHINLLTEVAQVFPYVNGDKTGQRLRRRNRKRRSITMISGTSNLSMACHATPLSYRHTHKNCYALRDLDDCTSALRL